MQTQEERNQRNAEYFRTHYRSHVLPIHVSDMVFDLTEKLGYPSMVECLSEMITDRYNTVFPRKRSQESAS